MGLYTAIANIASRQCICGQYFKDIVRWFSKHIFGKLGISFIIDPYYKVLDDNVYLYS